MDLDELMAGISPEDRPSIVAELRNSKAFFEALRAKLNKLTSKEVQELNEIEDEIEISSDFGRMLRGLKRLENFLLRIDHPS